VINIDANERNGEVVGMKLVCDTDEVMLITEKGILMRTRVAEIRETGATLRRAPDQDRRGRQACSHGARRGGGR
jgi:DNA gyrase/topoisomerase IV subunit A